MVFFLFVIFSSSSRHFPVSLNQLHICSHIVEDVVLAHFDQQEHFDTYQTHTHTHILQSYHQCSLLLRLKTSEPSHPAQFCVSFTPGINMRLGWPHHQWTALSVRHFTPVTRRHQHMALKWPPVVTPQLATLHENTNTHHFLFARTKGVLDWYLEAAMRSPWLVCRGIQGRHLNNTDWKWIPIPKQQYQHARQTLSVSQFIWYQMQYAKSTRMSCCIRLHFTECKAACFSG